MSADKQSRDDSAPAEMPWGRVAEDGTVYVRTADGERSVGSYEAGTPEEALEFFTKRFDELEGKVHLLEQRVASGRAGPRGGRRRRSSRCASRSSTPTRSATSSPSPRGSTRSAR